MHELELPAPLGPGFAKEGLWSLGWSTKVSSSIFDEFSHVFLRFSTSVFLPRRFQAIWDVECRLRELQAAGPAMKLSV